MLDNNYRYSVRLFEYCAANEVPLIYASSAAVYGASNDFKEDDRAAERPLNVYGYSKLLFDQYVRRHASARAAGRGLALLQRLRTRARRTRARWRASRSTCNDKSPSTARPDSSRAADGYADGEQRRDFVYVGDVASVNLWLLDHARVSGVFNVGTGASATFNDVARAIIARSVRARSATSHSRPSSRRAIRASRRPISRRCARRVTARRSRTCAPASRAISTRSAPGRERKRQGARRRPILGRRHGDGAGSLSRACRADPAPGAPRARAAMVFAVARADARESRSRSSSRRRHGELKFAFRRSLALSLAEEGYTEAIVLPRSFKAALVPWFARIPKRTGFRGEWRYGLLNDVRELDRARLDQTVKRFVALGWTKRRPPTSCPRNGCRACASTTRTSRV